MKVKIKDLHPNPYRDMENYPINREKVETLKASIEHTGFWDNILAREQGGNIQIAYGHHRLTALQEVLSPDDTVDIPVKDLPDSLMIKIMANENMEEYKIGPGVIDETVKVARKFLLDNPDEIKKVAPTGATFSEVGGVVISKFLGGAWGKNTVSSALTRLRDTGQIPPLKDKEGKEIVTPLDKDAVYKLPTNESANSFKKAVKKWDLEPEKQAEVIREIVDTSNYGYDSIEERVSKAKWASKPKEKKSKEDFEKEMKTIQFNQYVNTVFNKSLDLQRHIADLRDHKEQFGYLSMQDIKDARIRGEMLSSLKNLAGRINELLKLIQNENDTN